MNEHKTQRRTVPPLPATCKTKLGQRIVRAAETALYERQFVTSIDVLVGIGWLSATDIDRWRQGRVDYLERVVVANLGKISSAMHILRSWAMSRGLNPRETAYLARTRDRRKLRFSKTGNHSLERAYRTHWVSPALSEAKQERLAEKQSHPEVTSVAEETRGAERDPC